MRVRPQDSSGDYTMGVPFLVNNRQFVAQKISTRLKLWAGEWFEDLTDGTPYFSQVLGERSGRNPDSVIKQRILGTPGVTRITAYSSAFDSVKRLLVVNADVDTQFGRISITEPVAIALPETS